MRPEVATDEYIDIRIMLMEILVRYGVNIITSATVKSLTIL